MAYELSEYHDIVVRRDARVEYLTFQRPPVNAFTEEMGKNLLNLLEKARDNKNVGVVVLRSEGDYFSTGVDLKAVAGNKENYVENSISELLRLQREVFNPIAYTLYTYDKPIIAALSGTAAGAGLAFALGCDLMYAKNQARLVFNTIDKGLFFACGGSYLLAETIGQRRAKELLFKGGLLTAKEAYEEKLVRKVSGCQESLDEEVTRVAENIAQKSPEVLMAVKQSMRLSADEFKKQLFLEEELQEKCLQSEEFKKGLAAFLRK